MEVEKKVVKSNSMNYVDELLTWLNEDGTLRGHSYYDIIDVDTEKVFNVSVAFPKADALYREGGRTCSLYFEYAFALNICLIMNSSGTCREPTFHPYPLLGPYGDDGNGDGPTRRQRQGTCSFH